MFLLIFPVLLFVPFKPNFIHKDNLSRKSPNSNINIHIFIWSWLFESTPRGGHRALSLEQVSSVSDNQVRAFPKRASMASQIKECKDMSILQDPVRALNQIEWYLSNRDSECFPGAFLLAAGNLCRQVLEQVLFVLAFYSGLPRNKYLSRNGQMHQAGHILKKLRQRDSTSGKTYFQLARDRGPRTSVVC